MNIGIKVNNYMGNANSIELVNLLFWTEFCIMRFGSE
jgi:hypothetical protein